MAGSRTLTVISVALLALLAALGVVQYQWSARVAAADLQREKEHLESAATLFSTEFNALASQAIQYLQNDAWTALQTGERVTALPKLVNEVWFLNRPEGQPIEVQHLGPDGRFEKAALPAWLGNFHHAGLSIEEPPALVAPLYDVTSSENREPVGVRVMKTFQWRNGRSFVARIDVDYLRTQVMPRLIRRSFGETASTEYDFALRTLGPKRTLVYGPQLQPDLVKPILSAGLSSIFARPPIPPLTGRSTTIIMQRIESQTRVQSHTAGPEAWQLEVAHKGVSLAQSFERRRWRDLALSLTVELLLAAAIAFVLLGARRAQRLADQKMRFVAGVSHELRTPVSAISMLSRNQADGLVTGTDKVKQYGELIHEQCRRLNEMVEQTLQLAGIHSGLRRPARNPVDLTALIRQSLEARAEEFAHASFEVETNFAELPPIEGDEKLLRTAFDNLLDNALKHAGAGRWIRVTTQHATKEVLVCVEDRGAGIHPSDQASIFEPFARGRAAVEAQVPGSGLGLSLVRSAAEAHHGTITLVSEPGQGSTFTLHLPL